MLHADEVRNPDGGLVLIVGSAAAVEVAIFFAEDVEVQFRGPVFAFCLDHVLVGEEENGFVRTCAMQASDQVELGGDGSAEEDVGVGEAAARRRAAAASATGVVEPVVYPDLISMNCLNMSRASCWSPAGGMLDWASSAA